MVLKRRIEFRHLFEKEWRLIAADLNQFQYFDYSTGFRSLYF